MFLNAIPVWLKGREEERNLTLQFKALCPRLPEATICIATSGIYNLWVNGSFAASDVIHLRDDALFDIVSEMTEQIGALSRNSDLYALSRLTQVLLFLAEHHTEEDPVKTRILRPDIQKVLDFISYHYANPITVMDMSRLVALERSYFCRTFKNAVGVSPKDYLTKFRLDKARLLLTETSMPIGKVSEAVGFQSFSSFSRLFTTQYQQSPSQYRKTFLKEEAESPCLGSH